MSEPMPPFSHKPSSRSQWKITKNRTVGLHSSFSITTRYGLDGPRIQSRWEPDFPRSSRPDLGPT